MKRKTIQYSWQPVLQSNITPCDRFKHATCICRSFLYIYGGRQNTTLSDFWRYKIESNEWERLDNSEDGPEELEEHSMVECQGILYIFGGMVDSAFTQKKNPLWMYDTGYWDYVMYPWIFGSTWSCVTIWWKQGTAPVNRKGHSAVVYRGSMYMYGGYVDLKGTSQEFWTLCFDTKQWSPLPAASYGNNPGPRHGHSAVVYDNGMYLFGGLMGLSEQKDFWKWDFMTANWSNIKWSQGPPKMVGHSALIFEDSMLVFGGGVFNTRPSSTLWKYHFPSQIWKKLANLTEPSCKSYHCTLGIGLGFPGTDDSPRTSTSYLHSKEKGCSKLLAISKRHACFCENHQEPRYQTFSNEDSNEIEMKTFRHSQEQPRFCLFHTTSSEEQSAKQAVDIWCRKERMTYLNLAMEQEFSTTDLTEKDDSFSCSQPGSVDPGKPSAVLLLGGKPLSGSSAISFWQMEL